VQPLDLASSSAAPAGARAPSPAAMSPALGFRTLEEELEVDRLEVSGSIPPWLAGSLLRTGPAKFEIGESRMRHWFDGLAMLHRFTIGEGRVSYGGRYLHSAAYRAAREQGRIVYGEFATDPCRSLFKRVQSMFAPAFTDNANVNVSRLGERFVALTETPIAVEFDPRTLRAANVPPYRAPGQLSTAHPHRNRGDGGMLNYAAKLGPRSCYRFYAVDPHTARTRTICSLPVSQPAYMHSFGLTERWLVLTEFPLVVNPLALALAGRPYIENYRWRPERGTRVTLVDRSSGEVGARFETDACFSFHHVNAYEQGGEVIVDMCAYEDASVIEDLYLERLRAGSPVHGATLTRLRLRPGDGAISSTALADGGLELPRINYGRCNERAYRYVWGNANGPGGWLESIVKVDTHDGTRSEWSLPGCYPGEPVFVAAPRAEREDEGVLLSIVLDAERERSFMLVLDAATLQELARAEVPVHIPFGFHGQFARETGAQS
jgi:beta,beta-carotene 9',10'-dioxygenase